MKQTEEPEERLNPLNDYLFFKVMGEKGDEKQLISFLNAVLAKTRTVPIAAVEIVENKTFTAEIIGSKASILDIRAVLEDETRVNIEVQLRNYGNMDKRSLFYWGNEFIRGIDQGDNYRDLPKVIAINIVDFEYLPAGSFHTTFHLWEDTQRDLLLTDALEIHFLDMVKFRALEEKDIKGNPLHRWLTWLDKDSPDKVVKEIVHMDKAIESAQARAAYVSSDKEALRAYQMRKMAQLDLNSGLSYALREGEKKGEQKGEQKEKKKIAHNLKALGIPIGQIAQATGLSEAEIGRL
jgi:predicted transposase/invertase (TIGR01784 family)